MATPACAASSDLGRAVPHPHDVTTTLIAVRGFGLDLLGLEHSAPTRHS